MIKPKQPLLQKQDVRYRNYSYVERKPSLPVKRTSSVVSNNSCLSDRIPDNNYKKYVHPSDKSNVNNHNKPSHQIINMKNNISVSSTDRNDANNSGLNNNSGRNDAHNINARHNTNNSGRNHDKQKDSKQKQMKQAMKNKVIRANKSIQKYKLRATQKSNSKDKWHNLTIFQWLLIFRRCFYYQNKKRQSKYIKQRTLINYIRNKMYPNSLWSEVLAHQHQIKFSNQQIIQIIQQKGKYKMNLDDLFICLSQGYKNCVVDDPESAAQTARFVEKMKTQQQLLKIEQEKSIENKRRIHHSSHTPITMDSIDINSFQAENSHLQQINISPISVISQTNNISFSIEQSSQFSQTLGQRFEIALSNIETIRNQIVGNAIDKQSLSSQKKMLIDFMEEITKYSLYKSTMSAANIDTNISNKRNQNNYTFFYGLKLQSQTLELIKSQLKNIPNLNKNYDEILKKLFSSQNFIQYFQYFSAIKINRRVEVLPYILGALSFHKIKILNIAHNGIKSLNSLKALFMAASNSLELINLNNNKLTNVGQLLVLPALEQLYLKNNLIDHVLMEQSKVAAFALKIIDLSNNQIQKQQDLWALSHLHSLKRLNLYGNSIMNLKKNKRVSVINQQIINNFSQLYIFSAYTQYKDIAFQSKKNKSNNISNSSSLNKLGH